MADQTQIQKPMTFTVPPDIRTMLATHLITQVLPGRFIMSFFECLPPVIVGNTEAEKLAAWNKISTVEATCVARIDVREQDFEAFLQTLQQQWQAVKQQAHGFRSFA